MIKIIRNGYDVKFFESEAEAQAFMDNTISQYSDLSPVCIYNNIINTSDGKEQLIIYQYRTCYREVFEVIYY